MFWWSSASETSSRVKCFYSDEVWSLARGEWISKWKGKALTILVLASRIEDKEQRVCTIQRIEVRLILNTHPPVSVERLCWNFYDMFLIFDQSNSETVTVQLVYSAVELGVTEFFYYLYLERRETYTVEEAIDKIGYGAFQMKLMFVIGLAWVRPHLHRPSSSSSSSSCWSSWSTSLSLTLLLLFVFSSKSLT